MRISHKAAVIIGAVAMGLTFAASPAFADPPSAPATGDIVGTGSDTTQDVLNGLSAAYDATGPAAKLYSWDATPQPSTITPKSGCASINRPDGSGAGIAALNNDTAGCLDFARSSRPSNASETNLKFIPFAKDAVTYAGTSTTTSHVVNGLSIGDLKDIYLCNKTNWNQFGGADAPIVPILPNPNSGTRAFFLQQLGGGTAISPGACVINGFRSGTTTIIQENDARELTLALGSGQSADDAVLPFSVAKFIWYGRQTPVADQRGTAAAHSVKDSGGTVVNPINGTVPNESLNTGFTSTTLTRNVFNVVKLVGGAVPSKFAPIFNRTGYVCSTAGQNVVANYGFGKLPTLQCGY
ncbi:substrate-binding domain-containing protein [Actinoallomurus vinaceus]|uniref:Substrate-binding domain-containing protein n=1 Tax=Actinoallomurus vinaceus TaxID=1080074 RepID=A0ABP8U9V2_9ACTN